MNASRYFFYLLLTVIPAIFLSCSKGCNLAENYVRSNDFLIWNISRFENTAKVIPPGANNKCILGKIIVCTGQTRPGEIVSRALYNSDGSIDTLSLGTSVPYPVDTSTESIATDNQIIRLKDGSFLAMKNGYTWEEINPHPAWWNSFDYIGSSMKNGGRNSVYVWISTDCGSSWQRQGKIDAAKVLSGKYGWPQPTDDDNDGNQDKDANGKLIWWIGGFDRTEIYQNPWSGTIYISGHGDGGPYKSGAQTISNHNEVIFYSTDNGKTWDVAKEIDNGAPIVMTSTPNGRFYAFSCSGGTPKLYITTTPGDPSTLNNGFSVFYEDEVNGNKQQVSAAVDQSSHILRNIQQPSISRVSLDASTSVVRIAYSALNSSGRQVYKIINVKVDDNNPSAAPEVTSVKTIQADDPAKFSCVFGCFIDPEFNEIPSGYQTNKALFYWIETSTGNDPAKISAKYVLFHNDYSMSSQPDFLSRSNGAPRYWNDKTGVGDYMSGGFFWANNELNYFAQWVDAAGIHGNIVTVPK